MNHKGHRPFWFRPLRNSSFRVLFREFLGQFFASETVTSEIRLRQVMIAVLAFLITPGFFFSVQMMGVYAQLMRRAPQMVEPMTRLLATIFISFSTVAVGLVAAFVWDALSFDRRDAMILGPLPIPRWTVVGAKLAAMATFLLGTSLAITLVTAVPFSLVSSTSVLMLVRNFMAHVVATSCAALFVFSVIVMIRSAIGMMTRGHLGSISASFMQLVFISALLCFFILVPTTMDVRPRGRGMGVIAYVATVPGWMPTNWFVAMYVTLRGTADREMAATGGWAALGTAAVVAGAVLLTLAGYTRQLQLALTPSAWTGAIGRASLSRTIARALVGANRGARAVSDFIVMSVARNRAQQAPIAMNMAIGVGLLIIRFARYRHDFTMALQAPPSILLAAPLMLIFWTLVGVRASFFVPCELPAAWTFRTNAPAATDAYALATRAAIIGLVAPPATLAASACAMLAGGWPLALLHGAFTLLLVAAFADFIALTIADVPFTRPYKPGHAKLKSRWPLYLFGAYGFSDGLTALELYTRGSVQRQIVLVASTAAAVAIFEWSVRRSGRTWSIDEIDAPEEGVSSVTVLDIGTATPKSAQWRVLAESVPALLFHEDAKSRRSI